MKVKPECTILLKGCELDIAEDDAPITAMDTPGIDPHLTLDKKELSEAFPGMDDNEFGKLDRYFELVKRMINTHDFGITLRDIALELPKEEPDLGKKEYVLLSAWGVLGEKDSAFHLDLRVVYIDVGSDFCTKAPS
jgi:hypothetical protein